MKQPGKDPVAPAGAAVRRRQILYGDGTALEPDDESLEGIAGRLGQRRPSPVATHPVQSSSFVQFFLQKFSADLKRIASSKIIEAEVIECAPVAPVALDLSTGTGVLDPAETRPSDLRAGKRVWVSPIELGRGAARAPAHGKEKPIYSIRLASGRRALSIIESIWAAGLSLDGVPAEYVSGQGWIVDVDGVMAVLPEEEIGSAPIQANVGARFAILHYDPVEFCVVLSRKKYLNKEFILRDRIAREQIKPGQILSGRVVSVGPSSAAVEIGNVLVNLSGDDAGYGPARDNLSVLKPGDPVRVFVLDVTPDKISVGIRQLYPDPWVFVKKSLQPGSKVEMVVLGVSSDRVKVELKEGVAGEIPWKESGWQIDDPSELPDHFKVGQSIEAVCLSIQRESSKIQFSVKALQPDPLVEMPRKYPVGHRCEVAIVSVNENRARVVTDEGFYGAIFPEDLSWSGPVSPAQFFAPSGILSSSPTRRVQVEVLSMDPSTRLVRFGLKQVKPDPFIILSGEIEVGKIYEGRVVKIIPVGALMEIRKGLVGLLRKIDYAADETIPAEGQKIQVMVMNIQPQQHRMTLSRRAVVEQEERRDLQPFLSAPPEDRKVRMKDIVQGDVFKRFFEKP